LAAQMPGPRTQTIPRTPATDSQLTALFVGHKPVIGLSLFIAANVARNCLPDHVRSLQLHSLAAELPVSISSRFQA
jgi:hypothetical protein